MSEVPLHGKDSQTLVSLSLRLKDLLGPVTRVKKKKFRVSGQEGVEWGIDAPMRV